MVFTFSPYILWMFPSANFGFKLFSFYPLAFACGARSPEEEKLWFLTLPPQGSIEDWLRKGKGKNPAKLWVFTLCTFWFLPFWVFTLPEGRVKNQSFAGLCLCSERPKE
jgi:hypothetical protein